jgi:putative alpha-1,2-mannosidase
MAKAGPDSDYDNAGGFSTDSGSIMGFSHMHDSGTGGVSYPLAVSYYSYLIKPILVVRDELNVNSSHHRSVFFPFSRTQTARMTISLNVPTAHQIETPAMRGIRSLPSRVILV